MSNFWFLMITAVAVGLGFSKRQSTHEHFFMGVGKFIVTWEVIKYQLVFTEVIWKFLLLTFL